MRIGIDLGGTKIEAIVLGDDNDVLFRRRVLTPVGDYDATLETIRRLVEELEAGIGGKGSLGIATPGSLSPKTGLMRNANSVCLNDRPLSDDLTRLLDRPIRMANDADCFALSEALDGAAKGAGSVFGVIIGTGTGGGLVAHDRLVTGPNAVAGEWGHNPLPWPGPDEIPGPPCYCGKHGCIETFLSGPGLTNDYRRSAGEAKSAEEISRLASGGDSVAEAVLRRYEDRLARGLASVINIFDPEVIVLGGGLSNVSRLYLNVPRLWSSYVFSDQVSTRLLPPMHGDSSGVRGAARLWDR